MKRVLAVFGSLALGIGAYGLAFWAVTEGLDNRPEYVPLIYSVSLVGMLLFSLLALGAPAGNKTIGFWGFSAFFQALAVTACVLREPGHALAAEKLFVAVNLTGLLVVIILGRSDSVAPRVLRWAVLGVLSGIPPGPGFFARVDVLSAMIHSGLPWLAVWSAIAQVLAGVALIRLVFGEMLPQNQNVRENTLSGKALSEG